MRGRDPFAAPALGQLLLTGLFWGLQFSHVEQDRSLTEGKAELLALLLVRSPRTF